MTSFKGFPPNSLFLDFWFEALRQNFPLQSATLYRSASACQTFHFDQKVPAFSWNLNATVTKYYSSWRSVIGILGTGQLGPGQLLTGAKLQDRSSTFERGSGSVSESRLPLLHILGISGQAKGSFFFLLNFICWVWTFYLLSLDFFICLVWTFYLLSLDFLSAQE